MQICNFMYDDNYYSADCGKALCLPDIECFVYYVGYEEKSDCDEQCLNSKVQSKCEHDEQYQIKYKDMQSDSFVVIDEFTNDAYLCPATNQEQKIQKYYLFTDETIEEINQSEWNKLQLEVQQKCEEQLNKPQQLCEKEENNDKQNNETNEQQEQTQNTTNQQQQNQSDENDQNQSQNQNQQEQQKGDKICGEGQSFDDNQQCLVEEQQILMESENNEQQNTIIKYWWVFAIIVFLLCCISLIYLSSRKHEEKSILTEELKKAQKQLKSD